VNALYPNARTPDGQKIHCLPVYVVTMSAESAYCKFKRARITNKEKNGSAWIATNAKSLMKLILKISIRIIFFKNNSTLYKRSQKLLSQKTYSHVTSMKIKK
jgi:hypothetical protein